MHGTTLIDFDSCKLPLNGTTAQVVLCDPDLLIQGNTSEMLMFHKR